MTMNMILVTKIRGLDWFGVGSKSQDWRILWVNSLLTKRRGSTKRDKEGMCFK